ncbi:MAG: hypothetical protein AAFR52_04360, partial [Pseudomonadota bacterium]
MVDQITSGEWSALSVLVAVITLVVTVGLGVLGLHYAHASLVLSRQEAERSRARALRQADDGAALRRDVVGRDGTADNLERQLAAAETAGDLAFAALHGGPGRGKTTLARLLARRARPAGRRVLWVEAATAEQIRDRFARFASEIDPTLPADHGSAGERAAHAKACLIETATTEPWLVVYDNVERPAVLEGWLMEARCLHLVATSRWGEWRAPAIAFEVPLLSPTDARRLLEAEAGRPDPGAGALVGTLDRLPLALVQAGQWLRGHPGTGFAAYGARLAELLDDWAPDPDQIGDYDRSVMAAIELSLR